MADNNAVERLANAWAGLAKLKVRFKTVAGKAQVRIMADFGNRREEIRTWADEALLEIVVNALNGKMNVEEYLSTEHPALIIEELETENVQTRHPFGKETDLSARLCYGGDTLPTCCVKILSWRN